MDSAAVISSIQVGISLTTNLLNSLKALKKMDKEISNLDIREQVVEVRKQLVDTKDQITTLLEENRELRKQVDLADELQFDNELKVYWRIKKSLKEGPFCSICYGENKKVIPLHETDPQVWDCPKCKTSFEALESILQKRESLKALSRSRGF